MNRIFLTLIAVVLTLACFSVVSAAEPIGGNQGWIAVHCNVDGAQVYFDGTYEGVITGGILTVPVYSTGTPLKSFTVSKTGYTTYTAPPFQAMPGKGETFDVYAALNAVVPITPTPTMVSTPEITLVPQTTKTIIYMRNNMFVPQELTVLPGTGVSWVNEDSLVHSVKITGIHAGMFNSGDIIPGASSGNTFGTEGVFEFMCPDHPAMTGTIVVKNVGTVTGTPTTQTIVPTTVPTTASTTVPTTAITTRLTTVVTTAPTSLPTVVPTTGQTTSLTTAPTTSQTTIKTPTPTPTPNYDAKIAALESQLAVQNQKIEEQGNILDKITSFLRNIFGWK